ncbi:hypothetical protein OIU84_011897 [Salix udensis]|uniref:Endonuclease/exonuclease/phosphatase domain-containing protein n=1 Tax=Salix udensis TaxID=889485 RepID=A0AAD6NXJ1_9ROSI|nr:hypothetical protein OIU84_011897 [Salix udensis]
MAHPRSGSTAINITFVYGLNSPGERRELWDYIKHSSVAFNSLPWVIMGDFNAILDPTYKDGGDKNWYGHSNDFANAILSAGLAHLPFQGPKFSWHNGQHGTNTIQKKLDWTFGNHTLLQLWPSTISFFHPRNISDHSAMHTQFTSPPSKKKTPFHFLNLWLQREEFHPILTSIWAQPETGNPMTILLSKLRSVKARLKTFHSQNTSHISRRLHQAREEWAKAQMHLDQSPASASLRAQERAAATLHARLSSEEEAFYKQQSRVQWLQLGDQNTKFFHRKLWGMLQWTITKKSSTMLPMVHP